VTLAERLHEALSARPAYLLDGRWLEAAGEAREAYVRWREAPEGEREAAFAAYVAALDREEAACRCWAGAH
jgi:hypothetical protein